MEVEYRFDDEAQFWQELEEIADCAVFSSLRVERLCYAFVKLVEQCYSTYLLEDKPLLRCVHVFLGSNLFKGNRHLVRRVLIGLVKENSGDGRVAAKILAGLLLLVDGQTHRSALEMLQEESGCYMLIKAMWSYNELDARLSRIYLDLLFEMCKIQVISANDLSRVSPQFIEFLFFSLHVDTNVVSVVKAILALNEQYMLLSASAFQGRNLVLETLVKHGNKYRQFGEHLVFIFNRAHDATLRIMCLKLFYLVFNSPATYQFFYLNDLKVILDVMLRDMHENDEKVLQSYLRVLYPLLVNTQLTETEYKRNELAGLLGELRASELVDTRVLASRCLCAGWLQYQTDGSVDRNSNSESTSLNGESTSLNGEPNSEPNSELAVAVTHMSFGTRSVESTSSLDSLTTKQLACVPCRDRPVPPRPRSRQAARELLTAGPVPPLPGALVPETSTSFPLVREMSTPPPPPPRKKKAN